MRVIVCPGRAALGLALCFVAGASAASDAGVPTRPGATVFLRNRGPHVIEARGPLRDHPEVKGKGSPFGLDGLRPIDRKLALSEDDEVLILRSAFGNWRVLVPVEGRARWLRPLISRAQAGRALRELAKPLQNALGGEPSNDRVAKGEFDDLVQMFRVLRTRAGKKELSYQEQGIFRRVHSYIADELSVVRGISRTEASALLPQWPAFTGPCASLMKAVASGKKPLPALKEAKCPKRASTWAVLHAEGEPSLGHLARERRAGGGVIPDDFMPNLKVQWEGDCLARVPEALPAADGRSTPPASCLTAATIREDVHPRPTERSDARAGFLLAHEAFQEAWRECRKDGTSAEGCLDALLPLEGDGKPAEDEATAALQAQWLSRREVGRTYLRSSGEGRCRPVLHDPASGALAYRCEGTLVEALCQATYTASITGLAGERDITCAPDDKSLAVFTSLGTAPSDDCAKQARAALKSPKEAFPEARTRAFDACWKDEVPDESGGFQRKQVWVTEPRYERSVPPATRALLERVLTRQEALFGPIELPPRCSTEAKGCEVMQSEALGGDEIGRVVARGCGHALWAVEDLDGWGAFGNGQWNHWEGRWLTRLHEGEKLREPASEGFGRSMPSQPPFGIGKLLSQGSYFEAIESGRGRGTHTMDGRRYRTQEAELIVQTCMGAQLPRVLCLRYAHGGRVAGLRDVGTDTVDRMRGFMALQWPRANVQLERAQRELALGVRLDIASGESVREDCVPVLLDACTGDVAERCTQPEGSGFGGCEGRRLEDGRCEVRRFGRLPRLR